MQEDFADDDDDWMIHEIKEEINVCSTLFLSRVQRGFYLFIRIVHVKNDGMIYDRHFCIESEWLQTLFRIKILFLVTSA